jgi:hypothetical protein
MTRPSTGAGSRRYERYEKAGEDLTTQPERANDDPGSAESVEAVEHHGTPEQRRQFDQQYNNLNKGIPLHRGADQATHDATVAGLHGRNRSEAEIEAEEKRRHYSGVNHGVPLDHVGVPKENRDRLREAAKAELEVE